MEDKGIASFLSALFKLPELPGSIIAFIPYCFSCLPISKDRVIKLGMLSEFKSTSVQAS